MKVCKSESYGGNEKDVTKSYSRVHNRAQITVTFGFSRMSFVLFTRDNCDPRIVDTDELPGKRRPAFGEKLTLDDGLEYTVRTLGTWRFCELLAKGIRTGQAVPEKVNNFQSFFCLWMCIVL